MKEKERKLGVKGGEYRWGENERHGKDGEWVEWRRAGAWPRSTWVLGDGWSRTIKTQGGGGMQQKGEHDKDVDAKCQRFTLNVECAKALGCCSQPEKYIKR